MNKRLILTFVIITTVLDASGLGIIAPVLPSLIQDVSGLETSQAARIGGYMLFAFGFMQFFFGPIIGSLSDAFGRKPVLLISTFGMGLSYVILALAPAVGWLIFARVLGGATSATRATANAVITDLYQGPQKAKYFGYIGAAFGAGFILGPAFGGVLSLMGPRAPFWGAAALAFFNFAFGFVVFKETHPKTARRAFEWRRANPISALLKVGKSPLGRALGLTFLFAGLSATVFPSVFSFFTEARYGFEPWMIGVTMVVFGLSTALAQVVLVKPALKRFGSVRLVQICYAGQLMMLLCIAFIYNAWVLVTLMAVGGIFSIAAPTLTNMVSRLVGKSEQGELQGVLASIQSLASLIGTILMTQVFAYFSDDQGLKFDGMPYVFSAIFILIALLIFRSVIKEKDVRKRLNDETTAK